MNTGDGKREHVRPRPVAMVLRSAGVLLIGALCAGVAADDAAFDRQAAGARMRERLATADALVATQRELLRLKATGENVREAWAALEPAPEFDDLDADALRVVTEDPADEVAFHAIRVLLHTRPVPFDEHDLQIPWDSPQAALHELLGRLLARHHQSRAALLQVLGNLTIDQQAVDAFWETLLQTSTDREVRGNATARYMEKAFNDLQAPGVTDTQREALRARALELARIIRRDYADVPIAPGAGLSLPDGRRSGQLPLLAVVEHHEHVLSYSVGAVLPDVDAPLLRGGADTLGAHRGEVVLIDFWFLACKPCRRGQPDLLRFKQEMAGRPFEIIGISIDADAAAVIDYIEKKQPMPWTHWLIGPASPLPREWSVAGYPTYILLDASGMVRARSHHFDEAMRDDIRRLLRAMK